MSSVVGVSLRVLASAALVVGCGVSETESSGPPAHPALECGGDGSAIGNYDVIGTGFDTPEAALDDRLAYYRGLYGGQVVPLPDDEAGLRVDGAIVVVATASPVAEGGFLVQEDYSCNGFTPQQNGGPTAEPLVTTGS